MLCGLGCFLKSALLHESDCKQVCRARMLAIGAQKILIQGNCIPSAALLVKGDRSGKIGWLHFRLRVNLAAPTTASRLVSLYL
jgi:hypothetical protein